MPDDFLASLSSPEGPNLKSNAFWVQMERGGKQAMFVYPQGFERLEFSHDSSKTNFWAKRILTSNFRIQMTVSLDLAWIPLRRCNRDDLVAV